MILYEDGFKLLIYKHIETEKVGGNFQDDISKCIFLD